MKVDVLVDCQFGDCGKGKISQNLNEVFEYDSICKYNGGGNSGHAVTIDGKKRTAHYLTSGVYSKNTNIAIGPGAIINPDKFLKEMDDFDDLGIKHRTYVYPQVHITTKEHVEEDSKDEKIGTTRTGNGPTYRDKYARTGVRAESVEELHSFLVWGKRMQDKVLGERVLMEGSQGWFLDIDHGFYPYVTSSSIHPAYAFSSFGIPMDYLGTVYGVSKIYETYVGNAKNMVRCDSEKEAEKIRELGREYGETTGRPRHVGYLNIPRLIEAVNKMGVHVLFINKCDILEQLEIFKLVDYNVDPFQHADHELVTYQFHNLELLKAHIINELHENCPTLKKIVFSADIEGKDVVETLRMEEKITQNG